jgi:hypothetical protein
MKQHWGKWVIALLSSTVMTACAIRPPTLSNEATTQARLQMPLLPPSDWGQHWTQEQLLSIETHGQKHQVQALLSVSEQQVQLVILKFGQRLITIQHDAKQTILEKGIHVPEFLQAQQVLQDMQVVYAYAEHVKSVLPASCAVTEVVLNQREITCDKQVVYRIEYGLNDAKQPLKNIRLNNVQNQYSIQIDVLNGF